MSKKRIPNGDQDFLQMAQSFARNLGKEPEKYFVSREESDGLGAAVERYRAAFVKARSGDGRSTIATQQKEIARAEAERIIRDMSNVILANKKIDKIAKMMLGLKERGKAK